MNVNERIELARRIKAARAVQWPERPDWPQWSWAFSLAEKMYRQGLIGRRLLRRTDRVRRDFRACFQVRDDRTADLGMVGALLVK